MVGGTPSPSAPPGSAPPGPAGGGGTSGLQGPSGAHGFVVWPWAGIVFIVGAVAVGWRYRSWLMGVFENVEVMGLSGADLETELLHHEAGAEAPDETPNEPDVPAPDPGAPG